MTKFKKGDIVRSVRNQLMTYVVTRASKDGKYVDLQAIKTVYPDFTKYKNTPTDILFKV
jgi:hypothetical protein